MTRTLTTLFAAAMLAFTAGCASTTETAEGETVAKQETRSSACDRKYTGSRIKRCGGNSVNTRTTTSDALRNVGGSTSESGVTGRSSGGPPQD